MSDKDKNSDLTDQDVMTILNLFEESDFDYLQFEAGDLKLTVSKQGYVPDAAAAPAQTVAAQPAAAPAAPARVPEAPPPEVSAPEPPAPAAAPASREGLVPVTAPMVGTFYAAPDPQSPPFVKLGDRVGEGDTVGLIEVMKVFTGIRAGVAGEIAEIAVANAALVEQGAVLFYIRPDGAGG